MEIESPVTGQAVTALTSPTYTLAVDAPLETNQKAYIVTALGGTQTDVGIHNIVCPFQAVLSRPKVVRAPIAIDATAVGLQPSVPMNTHKLMIRKGLKVNGSGAYGRGMMTVTFDIPAGAPFYDQAGISAMVSLGVGILKQDANDLVNIITSGSL